MFFPTSAHVWDFFKCVGSWFNEQNLFFPPPFLQDEATVNIASGSYVSASCLIMLISQVAASGFGCLPSCILSMWPPRWCPSWATSCSMISQWRPEPVPRRSRSACCCSPSTLPTCWYRCWFSSRCCCPPRTIPTVGTRQADQRKESDTQAGFAGSLALYWMIDSAIQTVSPTSQTNKIFALLLQNRWNLV